MTRRDEGGVLPGGTHGPLARRLQDRTTDRYLDALAADR